ncbi:MAG: hypothetical protein LJE84_03105 [Gammaproteobacteria bacterium]|nr:hypothetical protein [Gammaproteobacteria bacterium]
MTGPNTKLKLRVAERSATAHAEIRPSKIERWINQLPVLDVHGNIQRLERAIAQLNATQLAGKQRVLLLDLYAEPVAFAADHLHSERSPIGLPPSPNQRERIAELYLLLDAMAMGYKAAVMDLATGSEPGIVVAIQRALRQLGLLALKRYEYYQRPPDGLFNEIHQLYSLARQRRLHKTPVDDALHPQGRQRVDEAYKRTILTALASPSRMRRGDVLQVWRFLGHFARLAHFSTTAETGGQRSRFLLQLDSDEPGIHCPGDPPADLTRHHLLLETHPLMKRIHALLTALRDGKEPEGDVIPSEFLNEETGAILRHLGTMLGTVPTRRFARAQVSRNAVVAFGIEHVNLLLNGGKPFEIGAEEEVDEITLATTAMGGIRQAMRNAPDTAAEFACRITDQSADGYQLAFSADRPPQIFVGQLMAVKSDEEGDEWSVGFIRWLGCDSPQETLAGVQRIPPGAEPIALRPVQVEGDEPLKRAILLPEVTALQQPSSLIAPRGVWRQERNLFLERPNEVHMVRAGNLIEIGHGFDWFEFQLLDI